MAPEQGLYRSWVAWWSQLRSPPVLLASALQFPVRGLEE